MAKKVSLKNVTIIELLVAINRRYSTKIALQIKEGKQFRGISYIDLGRRTSDTAYQLKTLGVERADKVAILSESRPEWAIAFFGIVSCAGIVVPLDTKLTDTELEFILNHSEAKVIFVSKEFIERIINLKPKLKYLQHIISFDDVEDKSVLLLKDFKVPPDKIAHREIYPDEVALIVYTSGTTGTAKGVELTYKNLLFEVKALNEFIRFSKKDNFLSILPLNHMLEITGGFLGPLYVGATVTYCHSLKPANILSLMNETKTTVLICVPLILKMFHNGIMKQIEELPEFKRKFVLTMLRISKFLLKFRIRIGKLFFSSIHKKFGGRLRCFICGGAPLEAKVELDFNALGFKILQGYGLTETSPVVTVNTFKECKFGSVGKPLKGVEVKILKSNETGSSEGEILVRGPNVMKGYYKDPQKTSEVLKDGWFYTGDIGYFDDDGFLYISGRLKNMIVLGAGKKVFPEEVEEVMLQSPYIKEICVLGRIAQKGLRQGHEEVYAVVVPNLDAFSPEFRQNKDFIREKISSEILRLGKNLAEYKRIMDFDIWYEELPKTSTRKIKRKVLLEMISQKEKTKEEFIETVEIFEDDLTINLKKIVAELTKAKIENIKLSSNLTHDLGIDSLMKIEIISAIDKEMNIDIPERFAYEINTFSDLVRFVKEYKAGRKDEDKIDDEINEFINKNTKSKLIHNITYFILKALFKIYFRKKVFGIENLPISNSFIIAANHSSMLDFPLILSSLPYKKMKDTFAAAAKDYFFTNKYRKVFVEFLFNVFPFDRMGDFMKGLKICEALIKNKRSVILFPEGSRTKDGKLQPFKPGLGSLAYSLKVPIVPVYIDGAFRALPKGRVIPLPKKIRIYFGEPIYPHQLDLSKFFTNYQKYTYISELTFLAIKRLKENSKNN